MQVLSIDYKTKTAGEKEILVHLKECAGNFIPPLTDRIDISAYSKKLAEKSVTFEAWQAQFLIGLIAAYFNHLDQVAFITNVSVSKNFIGGGIASRLLSRCIEYSKENNISQINLEVSKENDPAINFYRKFDFSNDSSNDSSLFMKLEL